MLYFFFPVETRYIDAYGKRIVLAKTFVELLGSWSLLHRDYNGKPDNLDLPVRWALCGRGGVIGYIFLKVSARNLSLIRSIKPAILEKPSQISPIHVNRLAPQLIIQPNGVRGQLEA